MHPDILLTIAQQQARSCPCGATPEHPHGLCRKCYAGMVWRRRKTGSARRTARRRRGRQSRERARVLALAQSMFRANGKGADL
jgi:hypothetical protein